MHRKFRRKNADVGTWTYARQLKVPPISAEEKREYKNMYT